MISRSRTFSIVISPSGNSGTGLPAAFSSACTITSFSAGVPSRLE